MQMHKHLNMNHSHWGPLIYKFKHLPERPTRHVTLAHGYVGDEEWDDMWNNMCAYRKSCIYATG